MLNDMLERNDINNAMVYAMVLRVHRCPRGRSNMVDNEIYFSWLQGFWLIGYGMCLM